MLETDLKLITNQRYSTLEGIYELRKSKVVDVEIRSKIKCSYKWCICPSDILLALEPPKTDYIKTK